MQTSSFPVQAPFALVIHESRGDAIQVEAQ